MEKKIYGLILLLLLIIIVISYHLFAITDNKEVRVELQEDQGRIEMQIFAGGYGEECWQYAIDRFKKEYPDIDVIVHMGPNVNEEMKTKWLTDSPPDFIFVEGPHLPYHQLIEDGKFHDLSTWYDNVKVFDNQLLKEHIREEFFKKDKGKYIIPYIFSSQGLFYNKSYFEQYSVSLPHNIDEFIETGRYFKERDIPYIIYPMKYPGYLWRSFVLPLIISIGGEELYKAVEMGEEGIFVSEDFRDAIHNIEKMANEGLFYIQESPWGHIKTQEYFLNGGAVFIPNGTWMEKEMEESMSSEFKLGFTVDPLRKMNASMGLEIEGIGIAISQKATSNEAVFLWLEYLFRDDIRKGFMNLSKNIIVYDFDKHKESFDNSAIHDVIETVNSKNTTVVYKNIMGDPLLGSARVKLINELVQGQIDSNEFCELMEYYSKLSKEKMRSVKAYNQ